MIQSLYSKYLELKDRNRKLSDRNLDLENRVDRLREEVSVIRKENVALLNVAYDMDRVVGISGEHRLRVPSEESGNDYAGGNKRRDNGNTEIIKTAF